MSTLRGAKKQPLTSYSSAQIISNRYFFLNISIVDLFMASHFTLNFSELHYYCVSSPEEMKTPLGFATVFKQEVASFWMTWQQTDGGFPEMGLPPVIIHFNRIFHYKPSRYGGTPMTMETPRSVSGDDAILLLTRRCQQCTATQLMSCARGRTSRDLCTDGGKRWRALPVALGLVS